MDVLLPRIALTLNADATLGGFIDKVRQWRVPEKPKTLVSPVVVIRGNGGNDELGLHGAAVNVDVEVEVWGYGKDQYKNSWRAARRISDVFAGSDFDLPTGAITRWSEVLAWQQIEQDDADTILLRATFRTRYWPSSRAAAVAQN